MVYKFNFTAAEKLPPNIMFGTSSWTYPGWNGMVYHRSYSSDKQFKATALEEYASFPWFRTVGVDSSFYAPLSPALLERYAQQVPSDFKWASKVWEEITIPHYAKHKRYGEKAGKENPYFLNADLFIERVLGPYRKDKIYPHAGPFIFEFQAFPKNLAKNPSWFFKRLDTFFAKLPRDFFYATEIRNKELLVPEYFTLLNTHSVSHCFNHWSNMPPLHEQMQAAAAVGGLQAPFFVARILTPLGVSYEQAVKMHEPYDQLKTELPEMRNDVVRLAKRAIQRKVPAFILVNNRAEGNAPQTIDHIGQRIVNEI